MAEWSLGDDAVTNWLRYNYSTSNCICDWLASCWTRPPVYPSPYQNEHSKKEWSALPGLGVHFSHCAAASCYFGKGFVISLRGLLFLSLFRCLLLKCLSHSKWSHLCHCSLYIMGPLLEGDNGAPFPSRCNLPKQPVLVILLELEAISLKPLQDSVGQVLSHTWSIVAWRIQTPGWLPEDTHFLLWGQAWGQDGRLCSFAF
jgi:hypothetical protein